MFDFFEDYEKFVKPTLEEKVEPTKNEDELFEIEEEKPVPETQPFAGFNEDELIDKISAKILEKLSNKQKEEVE